MAFDYPPDPAEDNHDHFRKDVQRDTVRDLGNSSISPGDGMLELRNSQGQVVGGMGDLPDGTFGVGIFRNGTFKNVNEWFFDREQINTAFAQRDATDANIYANLADASTRITTAQGAANSAQSTANTAIAQLGDASRRIDAAQGTANAAQSTANTVLGQLGDASLRIDRAQAKADTADSKATTALNQLGDASTRIARAQTTANNAQSDASSAIGAAARNAASLVALTVRVNSLQDQIDKMRGL